MSKADEDQARKAFVFEALEDGVREAVLDLRNMAAELVALGLDREGKRLSTIAAMLDCADDVVDAIEFVAPTMRSISWRLFEAQSYQQAHDLQLLETTLVARIDALREAAPTDPGLARSP